VEDGKRRRVGSSGAVVGVKDVVVGSADDDGLGGDVGGLGRAEG
jgi:hypothetical protein